MSEAKIQDFKDYVLKWNRKKALISRRSEGTTMARLIKTSLEAAAFIESQGFESIIDIGTGAGFPGMPLAIKNPKAIITLIERSDNKALFLKNAKNALGLDNVVVNSMDYQQYGYNTEKKQLITSLAMGQQVEFSEFLWALMKPEDAILLFINKEFTQHLVCRVSCETYDFKPLDFMEDTGLALLVKG